MTIRKRSFLMQCIGATILGLMLSQGAYAQAPAAGSIIERIASAKTKADHDSIAAEYDQQADADKSAADRHRTMVLAYTKAPWTKSSSGARMVAHCKSLIADYGKAAKQNAEMAKMHRDMGAKLP